VSADVFEIGEVARVSQTVEIHEPLDLGTVYDVVDDIGADETGPAGDEETHSLTTR
jgi:hypothetical protein